MFRENPRPQQPSLLSDVSAMPESQRRRLENSWAHTFREHVFYALDEQFFAELYAEVPSRPNVPVNVLVGLEILKAGMGVSDAELYESFLFDMQVRYALGYESLSDGHFAVRSLYHFRQRLSQHYQATGVNLLEVAFASVTDQQAQVLKVRTKTLRMDSTQIASDMVQGSRLYLLVEGVRRFYRMLSKAEQAAYADRCAPYLKTEAEHYCYNIPDRNATDTAIATIGALLLDLLCEFHARYAEDSTYQTIQRLFDDNFHLVDDTATPKENKEISSGALQSLDDLDASYRQKNGQGYRGYVASLTETCDPENDVQLILDVRVGPNNIDDAALLVDAMPDLAERTDIEELYTDGGYGSDDADTTLNAHGVIQIQTGLRGNAPDPDKLSLSDFVIEQDDQGVPTHLTCPQGQRVAVERGRSTGFVARFDPGICADCPLQRQGRCRAAPQKRNPRFALHFTQAEVFRAKRRQHHRDYRRTPGNLRAAVEATVRSVKHPFRQGKLPVRGLFRVTCMVIASAAMVNVRRIHQYWTWLMQSGRFAHIFRAGKPSSRPSTPASALCTNTRRLHWSPLRRRRCRPHITCFSC